MSEVLDRIRFGKLFAQDIVNNLVTDFSQYDPIYRKWSQRKVGRKALQEAESTAWHAQDSFKSLDTTPSLFPEIQTAELQTVMQGFADLVGRRYVNTLFYNTHRSGRQYNREVFPYHDGIERNAAIYLREIWAPNYAADFAQAHVTGLQRPVRITNGGLALASERERI